MTPACPYTRMLNIILIDGSKITGYVEYYGGHGRNGGFFEVRDSDHNLIDVSLVSSFEENTINEE